MLVDFDGTLSPIVEDPGRARPLPGVSEALVQLARRYACVAVVSGRPASFLSRHLGPDVIESGVVLVGLYGLERATPEGIEVHPDAARWRDGVEEVAREAEAEAPGGASDEHDLAADVEPLGRHTRAGPVAYRRSRKNARRSAASASGSSSAAKWPPAGITVQRRML